MVIYCKSVHFGGFSSPGTPGQAFYEMVSFSENRALRLLQESGEPQPGTLRVLAGCLSVRTGGGQAWLHDSEGALPAVTRWGQGRGGGGLPRRPALLTTPNLFRKQLSAPQCQSPEQNLPCWVENGLLQLQPCGDVEWGLPDRYGLAGAEEARVRVSVQRARGQVPLGTPQGPDTGTCGLRSW